MVAEQHVDVKDIENSSNLERCSSVIIFAFLFICSKAILLWTGFGTFSTVAEGCQWVIEPVSRHFFINQDL